MKLEDLQNRVDLLTENCAKRVLKDILQEWFLDKTTGEINPDKPINSDVISEITFIFHDEGLYPS